MAVPTLVSVTPGTIFTGGMLVTLTGTNFKTAYPLPVSNGVLADVPPTVEVLFDGVAGEDVQVYSATMLTTLAPAHDKGPVTVSVQNLDVDGEAISGELVSLPNAVIYARADLAVTADFTRLNKTLIKLLKQQVIENVAMSTSVDYSDQQGEALKVTSVAKLPCVTISPPSQKIRYGDYAEPADEETIGINFVRRSTFQTVDVTWTIRVYDDNQTRALNIVTLVQQVLKTNPFLSMDRDPDDLSKGKVDWDMYPNGEFNFADSANNSDVRMASCTLTLYGYWFEDIAGFPESAVVERGTQVDTVNVQFANFRP